MDRAQREQAGTVTAGIHPLVITHVVTAPRAPGEQRARWSVLPTPRDPAGHAERTPVPSPTPPADPDTSTRRGKPLRSRSCSSLQGRGTRCTGWPVAPPSPRALQPAPSVAPRSPRGPVAPRAALAARPQPFRSRRRDFPCGQRPHPQVCQRPSCESVPPARHAGTDVRAERQSSAYTEPNGIAQVGLLLAPPQPRRDRDGAARLSASQYRYRDSNPGFRRERAAS